MTWWYTRFARHIALGAQPPPTIGAQPEWIVPAQPHEGQLLVFCPTVTIAGNRGPQAEAVTEFAAHLRRGIERHALPSCLLLLGVHHTPDRRAAAISRLQAIRESLEGSPVRLAAFCTTVPGKVVALNVAIELALRSHALGLLQLDDDIRLEEGAIERLYASYRAAGRQLAVGAAKVGVPRPTGTSRLMRWSKQRTRTAINYPHACCMLLDPRLLVPGVPARYVSDDAYICFRLLRPEQPDPLDLLRLVPEARCAHYIGGPSRQAVRRVHGILLSVHVLLEDFPEEVSRYYFREILFPGFWPIGSRPARLQPLSWAVQAAYFAWFARIGLELALRGVSRRPLRDIGWVPVPDRTLPRAVA